MSIWNVKSALQARILRGNAFIRISNTGVIFREHHVSAPVTTRRRTISARTISARDYFGADHFGADYSSARRAINGQTVRVRAIWKNLWLTRLKRYIIVMEGGPTRSVGFFKSYWKYHFFAPKWSCAEIVRAEMVRAEIVRRRVVTGAES